LPTYQYACTECGHGFEAVQSFTDDALTECPQCTGRLRKVFNSVGIVFKGSGFYRTDSREKAGVGASKDGAKDGAKDSPAAAKADGTKSDSPAAGSSSGSGGSTRSGSPGTSSGTTSSGTTSSGASSSSGSSTSGSAA
jgi:putative FmdB family regulatory protein